MKIAIISDIHSNPKALERVLDDAAANGCSELVCLGDIVGYGYDPQACIDLLTGKDALRGMSCSTIIRGNHDAALGGKLPITWFSTTAAAGIRRQKADLGEKAKTWLGELPYTASRGFDRQDLTAFYAHGSYIPEDMLPSFFPSEAAYTDGKEMFPYMLGHLLVQKNVDALRKIGASKNILFVGHTHKRRLCVVDGPFDLRNLSKCLTEPEDLDKEDAVALLDDRTVVMNVGSVGYPRAEPFTSYVILDTDEKTAKYRKLRFHFREYIESMKARNIAIPGWMAMWRIRNGDDYIYIDEEGFNT